VSIACSQALTHYFLPDEVAKYRESFPNVTFEVVVLDHLAAENALVDYQVDLALVFDSHQQPDFQVTLAVQQELRAVMAADHPLASRDVVGVRDCLEYPIVLPTKSFGGRLLLEEAVARELTEETGVKINYLEQLYTFGKPNRDPRGRVVSIAYFGLIRPNAFKIYASTDAAQVQWFNINELPELSFDHKEILDTAIKRLKGKITYEPIGFELLDTKFPFSDLEKLYSTLLGREVDRRNFRKKIMGLNVLDELDEKVSKGSGRPANLFQFNQKRYFHLKEEGIIFEI